jgi:hypothetical protein
VKDRAWVAETQSSPPPPAGRRSACHARSTALQVRTRPPRCFVNGVRISLVLKESSVQASGRLINSCDIMF